MDKRQDFLATLKSKEEGIICYYCNKPGPMATMARLCYLNKRQTNRMSPKGSPTRYKTEWRDAQSHLANNRHNQNSKYRDNVPERQPWRGSYNQDRRTWRGSYNQDRRTWRGRNNYNSKYRTNDNQDIEDNRRMNREETKTSYTLALLTATVS